VWGGNEESERSSVQRVGERRNVEGQSEKVNMRWETWLIFYAPRVVYLESHDDVP